MDGIIFIIFILLVYLYFKNIMNFVYFMAVVDLSLRVVDFLGSKVDLGPLTTILPASFSAAIGMFFSGLVYEVLIWSLYLGYILMIFYLIKSIFKK